MSSFRFSYQVAVVGFEPPTRRMFYHQTTLPPIYLLPTGSEEREVFGVGSILVAILRSCQYMKMLHQNCININIVG